MGRQEDRDWGDPLEESGEFLLHTRHCSMRMKGTRSHTLRYVMCPVSFQDFTCALTALTCAQKRGEQHRDD